MTCSVFCSAMRCVSSAWASEDQSVESRTEGTERARGSGGGPSLSLHVYSTSTGASAPATRCCSSPPRSSLLFSAKACRASLCVCVIILVRLWMCVSLLWVTTCRKGRKRCPASKPVARGAWLAMWCKFTIDFFFLLSRIFGHFWIVAVRKGALNSTEAV